MVPVMNLPTEDARSTRSCRVGTLSFLSLALIYDYYDYLDTLIVPTLTYHTWYPEIIFPPHPGHLDGKIQNEQKETVLPS
jgi:hypothetical protein